MYNSIDKNETPNTDSNGTIQIVSGRSFRKDTYTLAELKEISLMFTKAATPSEFINGIEERFEKLWRLNFGG